MCIRHVLLAHEASEMCDISFRNQGKKRLYGCIHNVKEANLQSLAPPYVLNKSGVTLCKGHTSVTQYLNSSCSPVLVCEKHFRNLLRWHADIYFQVTDREGRGQTRRGGKNKEMGKAYSVDIFWPTPTSSTRPSQASYNITWHKFSEADFCD